MKLQLILQGVCVFKIELRNDTDQRSLRQLKRWRQESEGGNALIEHCARTDYKLIEAKAQLDSLNEMIEAFYNDMDRLKEAMSKEREKDQGEFVKRVADLLYCKEIVTWLQKPEVRGAFYGETNGVGVLSEREETLLNSVREIFNPSISWSAYEEIWSRMLEDFAKLGTEVTKDQNKAAIVHPNVCEHDVKLQTEVSYIKKAIEVNNKPQTEISDKEEAYEADVQFETEMLNMEEKVQVKSSAENAINSLISNNWCYLHVSPVCVGMLLVIVTSLAHNFLF
uniref:Caprin-1_dimer domain-containing protein n=1 Tax=Elaeophora elaphi TaxID=1147741 RepID=A0A0R3RTK3_9BILA